MTTARPANTITQRLRDLISERRSLSRAEALEILGAGASSAITSLARRGEIVARSRGIYSLADQATEPPAARTTSGDQPNDIPSSTSATCRPAFDDRPRSRALLSRFAPKESTIRRIYVSVPDRPALPKIYAQSVRPRDLRQPDAIRWGTDERDIPEEAVAATRDLVFPDSPTLFDQIDSLIPEGTRKATIELSVPARLVPAPADAGTPFSRAYDENYPLPCAYRFSDTRVLDVNSLRHPIPGTLPLVVDAREPAWMVDRLATVENLQVSRAHLEAGTHLVPGHLVIHRKSAPDFVASLADSSQQLIDECGRMAETGLHRILIVEGGLYAQRRFPLNLITSAISFIQNVAGVHVIDAMDGNHSVYQIVQSAKHRVFGHSGFSTRDDPHPQHVLPDDPSVIACSMLTAITGISQKRARALLERFGTLQAIAVADAQSLAEVAGIGSALATSIAAVFRQRPKPARPR